MRHLKARGRNDRFRGGGGIEFRPLPLRFHGLRRRSAVRREIVAEPGFRRMTGKSMGSMVVFPRPLLLLASLIVALSVASPNFRWTAAAQAPTPPGDDHPWRQRQELDQQFTERLRQLAERARQIGLVEQAEQTLRWSIPRDPRRDYLFLPKAGGDESEVEGDPVDEQGPQRSGDSEKERETSPEHHWRRHFLNARRQQAQRLFALAERSAERYPAEAYALLHEVLHEDPDHQAARAILGFRRTPRGWSRPGDIIAVVRGRAAMSTIGFAARQYHQVTTAHFRLYTDADPEAARQLAEQLEELHQVWRQVFFRFWSDGPTLTRRIQARSGDFRARTDKHQVVWFQDRARYLEVLQREEPQIEKTLGIYLDKRRIAFLYGDPAEMLPSWLHEITHQLFAETIRTAPDIGREAHMWIAEGVALHMESLRWFPGFCMLGGFDADRLQFARYRALGLQSVLPLAELTGMGREALQRDPRIQSLYSQSAGLTDFFLHAQQRRYREALIDYLKAVYSGRNDPQLLASLTETSYPELDTQYLEHLQVDDQQLFFAQPAVNLYLGHCPITDQGWAHVPVEYLQWLDLGFTSVTDAGLQKISSARQLRKLTLEHTGVTRQVLPAIGKLDQLEYLDLSGLDIRDDDLRHLATLERLESLWLTGTSISDAGLQHLQKLRNLRTLDVSETGVSTRGWQELKRVLPDLE